MSALLAPPEALRLWTADDVEPVASTLPAADPAAPGPAAHEVPAAAPPVRAASAAAFSPAPALAPEPDPALTAARTVEAMGAHGGATLGDVIADAWDALAAGAPASCPCCGTPLRPRWSAGAGLAGGRCDGCDARIE